MYVCISVIQTFIRLIQLKIENSNLKRVKRDY